MVAEPPQPKVKLRMPAKSPEPPKITLKFGGSKPSNTGGVSVDNEALRRQQDLVNAGMNGQASIRASPKASLEGSQHVPTANGIPVLTKTSKERMRSGSAEKPTINGVKTEASMGQPAVLGAVPLRADSSGSLDAHKSPNPAMMPPPSANLISRLPSGSPHPQSYTANHYSYSSTTLFDSTRRQSGKGKTHLSQILVFQTEFVAEALMTNLSLSTHPGLKIDKHFHLDIPPSPTSTQQSITVTLPSSYYYLQLAPSLTSSVMHRPYKIFVTVNNNRIVPTPQRADESSDSRKSLYEHRVLPGMNRIEVEVVAGTQRGAPKVGTGPDLEVEKTTIFVHLVKS